MQQTFTMPSKNLTNLRTPWFVPPVCVYLKESKIAGFITITQNNKRQKLWTLMMALYGKGKHK